MGAGGNIQQISVRLVDLARDIKDELENMVKKRGIEEADDFILELLDEHWIDLRNTVKGFASKAESRKICEKIFYLMRQYLRGDLTESLLEEEFKRLLSREKQQYKRNVVQL